MEKEIRQFQIENLMIEKREDGKPGKISGYAAVFNKRSEDLGWFVEMIASGAFKNALKKSDARALVNHDSNLILGRQSAGTLRLKEDAKGLFMEVDLPDTQYARDLALSIERRDIQEQSFGFTVKTDQWQQNDNEPDLRTLIEIDEIYDVSPVTFPAYPDTSVAKRSLEAHANGEDSNSDESQEDLTDDNPPDSSEDTAKRNDKTAQLLKRAEALENK